MKKRKVEVKMQAFIPLHVIHVICSIWVKSVNLVTRLEQHWSDLRTSNENNVIVNHKNNTDLVFSIVDFSTYSILCISAM